MNNAVCFANVSYLSNPLLEGHAFNEMTLYQAMNGAHEIIPHSPAFVLGRCLRNIYDKVYECSEPFFKTVPETSSKYEGNKIRKAIQNDVDSKNYKIDNAALNAMFRASGLESNEAEKRACYDLAYRIRHLKIYLPAKTVVPTSDYTLNFLWINLNPQNRLQDRAQNIFGEGDNVHENSNWFKDLKVIEDAKEWNEIKKTVTYQISKWAEVHPKAQMNFWYDSALVTKKAKEKTFAMFREISQSRGVDLKLRDVRQLLRDVRQLPIIGNIEASLHPGTPVYFRVDLCKAIIVDYLMSAAEESAKYAVLSDVDVEPMPPEQLFDQHTLEGLSSDGYVFNIDPDLGYFENSFSIFNKEKEGLQQIHRETTIENIASMISKMRKIPIDKPVSMNSEEIFRLYGDVFRRKMSKGRLQPFKVVNCPESKFFLGAPFFECDNHQEYFRFTDDSNVPYTLRGRNCKATSWSHIKELKDWKAVPV